MGSTQSSSAQSSLTRLTPSASPPPPPAGSTAQRCLGVWDKVLANLANHRQGSLVGALTACRLGNGDGGGADGEVLVIEVPDLTDCEVLFSHTPDHEQQLEQLFGEFLGQPLRVQIRGAPGASSRGRYRHAEQHPLVQQIRRTFDAEILAFEPMSEAEWERHLAKLSGEEA